MKTIRYLFYMMLLLSNTEVLGGDNSKDTFLNYLQEKGYYDIIHSVKVLFGDDIAIDVCLELIQSDDCKEVVRVYMPGEIKIAIPEPHIDTQIFKEILDYIENKYNISKEMSELIEVIVYYSLIGNMNKEEFIDIIERIIRSKRILNHLEQNKEM